MKAILGDITKLKVIAIVNAANTSLLGGSGVDGAIHRSAGGDLAQECRLLGGCKVGEAKITKGYNLPAQFIIHTVGPVWQNGSFGEADLLSQCYRNCLRIASSYLIDSIAFPCISTGIYKFPKDYAAKIAVNACQKHREEHLYPNAILFCCFDNQNYEIYEHLLA